MQDYRIELDVYHGPLDLLLYLIKRDEVDIRNIPVAPIAEQYMQYIRQLEHLDINTAGEFLVMASTLMEIKSLTLAPSEASEEGEVQGLDAADDPADPRYELIQQLLAYKRYKDAAYRLEDQQESFSARFAAAPAAVHEGEDALRELDLEDASIWDLVEAFGRMMDQLGLVQARHEVISDDTPIELHAADLVDRLGRDGPMSLQQIFMGRSHGEMVGLFLATLELVRQRRLIVKQESRGGEIHLALREAEADLSESDQASASYINRTEHDPKNADAFDWPDEETRKRYVRRQERRAKGEFVEEDAELEADIAEIAAREGEMRPDETQDETTDESAAS